MSDSQPLAWRRIVLCAILVVSSGCEVPEEADPGENATFHRIAIQHAIAAGALPLLEADCIDIVDDFAFSLRDLPNGSEATAPVITQVEAVQSPGFFDDCEPPAEIPASCRFGINVPNAGAIEVTAIYAPAGGEVWSEVCIEGQAGQLDEATFADGWVGFTSGVDGCVIANSTENAFETFPPFPTNCDLF